MRPEISTLDTAAIHADSAWSLHQDIAAEPEPELVESIRNFGLLRPIIVMRTRNRQELICGARRLQALQQLDVRSGIPCYIFNQRLETSALLQLIAEDQRQTAPLSPIETGRLIKMFERVDGVIGNSVLEQCTGVTSTSERKRLTALLKLEEPIRRAVHDGFIPVKNGLLLKDLRDFERIFLAELFYRLSLNGNKQRRLLELARIIAVSEQCSMVEVFTDQYPAVCSGRIDNVPQVSAQLMKNLFERSHPFLTAAHKQFNDRRKRLNLPVNCSLSPYPSFERDTVTLNVEFGNFDAFEQAWNTIQQFV